MFSFKSQTKHDKAWTSKSTVAGLIHHLSQRILVVVGFKYQPKN
jgi:uncharacterized protein YhbP (UPF0306 family)